MTIAHNTQTSDTTPGRSSQLHVLVVDDEPMVRRFAAKVLRNEGFGVHEAEDGAEALAVIGTHGSQLHVVVSDIVMPRLNGVQLLEALSVSHPHLPIILMSGYAHVELAERGITAPCAVLAKPFTAQRLIDEVRRCVREGR